MSLAEITILFSVMTALALVPSASVVLAEVAGGFFLLLRYFAAAYLIWFGIGILRTKPLLAADVSVPKSASLATSFLSGFILTLGDIKATFFYASLFPAFIDLTTITTLDITIIYILTIVAVGGVKLVYAYCASKMMFSGGGFKGQPAIKITAGSFMIGAGTYLMVKT